MRNPIAIVLLVAACAGKDADVDRYVNVEMSTSLVRLVQADQDVGSLKAGDVSSPGALKHLLHARKSLRAAHEAASKVVPPKKLASLHADLLGRLIEREASVDDLLAAAERGDAAKFATADGKKQCFDDAGKLVPCG